MKRKKADREKLLFIREKKGNISSWETEYYHANSIRIEFVSLFRRLNEELCN